MNTSEEKYKESRLQPYPCIFSAHTLTYDCDHLHGHLVVLTFLPFLCPNYALLTLLTPAHVNVFLLFPPCIPS